MKLLSKKQIFAFVFILSSCNLFAQDFEFNACDLRKLAEVICYKGEYDYQARNAMSNIENRDLRKLAEVICYKGEYDYQARSAMSDIECN